MDDPVKLTDTIDSILQHKGWQVWSVHPDASVYEAIEMMSDKRIGALLVMSEGELLGVISERDYARKVILKGKSSKDTPVKEIMTSPVITVSPRETVDECMRIITHHRIRHLPVIQDNKVLGIISIGDLVNWVISEQKERIRHLHNYIAGSYPA